MLVSKDNDKSKEKFLREKMEKWINKVKREKREIKIRPTEILSNATKDSE